MESTRPGRIGAILPCPRVGWNDSWSAIVSALVPCGISLIHDSSAFYAHSMDRLFKRRLSAGDDMILALDYDSMFTKQDLNKLVRRMVERPDIDALAALQARRGETNAALIGLVGKEGTRIPIADEPVKVDSAHFGLTLIRCSALKETPRPWFHSTHDSEGGFEGNDRVDADCFFWKQWREAGKTLYVDPTVKIGHLQLMVSEVAEGEIRHRHVTDWQREKGLA